LNKIDFKKIKKVRWDAFGFVRAIIAGLLYKLLLMKISETRTVSTVSAKKIGKIKAKQGPAFASHLKGVKDEPEGIAQADEVGGVAAVGSILAAQEIDEDDGLKSRKQLKKYGEDILDRLDEIKQDLLIGGISKDVLANLAQTLRMKKSATNDPGLISIIDDIELRAAVELAKYTRNL
jgi:hypothetical protein